MQPKISNTPMTQSARTMLHGLQQSMSEAMTKECWTFLYDKENKKLEMVQKIGSSCYTQYCDTKSELLTWYKKTLRDIADPTFKPALVDYSVLFAKYADYYGISYEDYIPLITNVIEEAYAENPEYFI